jgi:hypothetical protein
MSNTTRQWLVNQCKALNIPAEGTNKNLTSLIHKAATAQRKLATLTPATELPRWSLITQQQVRVIKQGNSYDGLCIRNRADWKFQVMQGGTMLLDFDASKINRIQYRHDRWMVWI